MPYFFFPGTAKSLSRSKLPTERYSGRFVRDPARPATSGLPCKHTTPQHNTAVPSRNTSKKRSEQNVSGRFPGSSIILLAASGCSQQNLLGPGTMAERCFMARGFAFCVRCSLRLSQNRPRCVWGPTNIELRSITSQDGNREALGFPFLTGPVGSGLLFFCFYLCRLLKLGDASGGGRAKVLVTFFTLSPLLPLPSTASRKDVLALIGLARLDSVETLLWFSCARATSTSQPRVVRIRSPDSCPASRFPPPSPLPFPSLPSAGRCCCHMPSRVEPHDCGAPGVSDAPSSLPWLSAGRTALL